MVSLIVRGCSSRLKRLRSHAVVGSILGGHCPIQTAFRKALLSVYEFKRCRDRLNWEFVYFQFRMSTNSLQAMDSGRQRLPCIMLVIFSCYFDHQS